MPRRVLQGRWLLFGIAVAVILLDQLSKFAVRSLMDSSQSVPIIGNVFHLTHVRNPGAAFGLFPGQQALFFAMTGAVVAFIIVYALRSNPDDRLLATALGLELGGAVGNLIDRTLWGRVTDFLDFRVFPVFNVADSSIVVGLGFVLLVAVLHGRREAQKQEAA